MSKGIVAQWMKLWGSVWVRCTVVCACMSMCKVYYMCKCGGSVWVRVYMYVCGGEGV